MFPFSIVLFQKNRLRRALTSDFQSLRAIYFKGERNNPCRGRFMAVFSLILNVAMVQPAYPDDFKEDLSYKLAIIHTQASNPENALLRNDSEPKSSVVSEFHWILETLRNRCINPPSAIADTMVEMWQKAKILGYPSSLLEVSRELSSMARNRILFGDQKVNFRMTSNYWLNQLQNRLKARSK